MRILFQAVAAGCLIGMTPTAALAQTQSTQSDAVTEEKLVEAEAIMQAMFPEGEREEIILEMIGTIGDQFSAAVMQGPIFDDPGIRAIMDEFIADLPETLRPLVTSHLPDMIDATALAYAREFSLEELRDIREFAQTPAGARYFREAQSLLADPDVAEANQRYFQSLTVIQQEQSSVVRQRVEAYLAANPEALERIQQKLQNQTN